MCIAQFMLIPRTSSYEEDDGPNLLEFVKEATLILEANDDNEDQENYFFEKTVIQYIFGRKSLLLEILLTLPLYYYSMPFLFATTMPTESLPAI